MLSGYLYIYDFRADHLTPNILPVGSSRVKTNFSTWHPLVACSDFFLSRVRVQSEPFFYVSMSIGVVFRSCLGFCFSDGDDESRTALSAPSVLQGAEGASSSISRCRAVSMLMGNNLFFWPPHPRNPDTFIISHHPPGLAPQLTGADLWFYYCFFIVPADMPLTHCPFSRWFSP